MSKLKHYKALKGLIQHKGKILLIETVGFIGGKYELPGGMKLNPKEEDTRFLKKKILTEVGLEVTVKKRLIRNWLLDLPEKGIHLDLDVFQCISSSNEVKPQSAIKSFIWVDKKDIFKYDCPRWVKDTVLKLDK